MKRPSDREGCIKTRLLSLSDTIELMLVMEVAVMLIRTVPGSVTSSMLSKINPKFQFVFGNTVPLSHERAQAEKKINE